MRNVALLGIAPLALAGCGSGDLGTAAQFDSDQSNTAAVPDPDGAEEYETAEDVRTALQARDAAAGCDSLEYDRNPTLAIEQGRCKVGEVEYVFQTWESAPARDDGTSQVIRLLLSADIDYCYVVGRGTVPGR